MNRDFSFFSTFFNRYPFGIFETVYAKSHLNEEPSDSQEPSGQQQHHRGHCPTEYAQDKYGGGDAPPRKRGSAKRPDASKSSTSDRGRTGAGVTGSRSSCDAPGPTGSTLSMIAGTEDLPCGARNPGLLRYIHNAARYRLPQCFEGACLNIKQRARSNWVLGHTMSFSSVSPGGYKLLLSYVDPDKPAHPPYFVIQAAPGGQISCEVRVGPSDGTRATIVTQVADGEFYSFESIFDTYFSSATASVIAVNKEFIALHYLHVRTHIVCLNSFLHMSLNIFLNIFDDGGSRQYQKNCHWVQK